MRRLALVTLVILVGAGCRARDPVVTAASDALRACDYREACAKAVAAIRGLEPAKRDTPAALEARLLAAHVLLNAALMFPSVDDGFVRAAGLQAGGPAAAASSELEALGAKDPASGTLAAGKAVLAFLREPACERLLKVDEIAKAGGRFADSAALARLSMLGQLVASIDASRVRVFADAARGLIGCQVSDRATPAAILVEARNGFYDAVEACPAGTGADVAVRLSCDAAREVARTQPLPLPLPDAAAGDLAGALLPTGKALGVDGTPPWAIVVAAGRVSLLEQSVLDPGVRQVPETKVTTLLDLRSPHRVQDTRLAVHKSLDGRKPMAASRDLAIVPVIADRDALAADLLELFEAILSESDGLPALAVLPGGLRWPWFLPINYRLADRQLFDALGAQQVFPKEASPVELDLTPVALTVRAGGDERVVGLPRRGDDPRGSPDLRDAYRAVLEMSGPGARPARMTVAPAVSAALLTSLLQAVAARTPPAVEGSAAAFAQAQPARDKGTPSWLLPAPVLVAPAL